MIDHSSSLGEIDSKSSVFYKIKVITVERTKKKKKGV